MAYREEGTLNTLAADSVIVKTDVVEELKKLTLSEAKISAKAIAVRLGESVDDITAATSMEDLITAVEAIDDDAFSKDEIPETPSTDTPSTDTPSTDTPAEGSDEGDDDGDEEEEEESTPETTSTYSYSR